MEAPFQLLTRGIYHHEPPPYSSRNDRNPTLLVSWWCTIFALTTILIRIMGRWVRTERLFREDKIMLWSIVPLLARMALVHVILIWGTNNTVDNGMSRQEILNRATASKLVLVARILYAAFIWIAKLTVLEFLKRTIGASWAKSYELGLRLIYGFLIITYIAVVIGTLTECRPFDHYWQVVPDPGPQCREGLVQLIVMGVCDIVTDVVLIAFPIPVVLRSSMPAKKKFSLIMLFLLSAILIAITAYRIPSTIDRQADQPYRSLLASLEILAAAGVSNAVIIGSFIRDKGVKKAKFRAQSVADSANGSTGLQRVATARSQTIALNHWGSDEDLVRDLGVALPTSLRHGSLASPRAPSAMPIYEVEQPEDDDDDPPNTHERHSSQLNTGWTFRHGSRSRSRNAERRDSHSSASTTDTDIKLRDLQASMDEPVSPGAHLDTAPLSKQMSFFDVGGLVDEPKTSVSHQRQDRSRQSPAHSPSPPPRGRTGSKQFLSDIGGMLSRHKEEDGEASERSASARRNLTPSKLMERRKKSRSPGKGLQKAAAAGEQGKKRSERSPQVRPPPGQDGPDGLSFGDIGGLLR